MQYLVNINNEKIDEMLFLFKLILVNIGTFYMFSKLNNDNKFSIKDIMNIFLMIFIAIIGTRLKNTSSSANTVILSTVLLIIVLCKTTNKNIGESIIVSIVAISTSWILFFISVILNSLPNIIFGIQNDYISFTFIAITYILITYITMKIKRLKNGLSFLNQRAQSEFFDIIILNISIIILFFVVILGNYNILISKTIFCCLIIFSIVMFTTIKKSFQVYYKQRLLIREVEETKIELDDKKKEIEKLEQENLSISKKNHSLAHKQKSLEHKLNKLMLKYEIAEEIDIKDTLENISKELCDNTIKVELPKTGIADIDDMFNYMQSECINAGIEFNLQINGNIHYMINNIIEKQDLEILIADHVKDAKIAIENTENVNKSILVKLGIIENCYGLYVYDSGIEFEEETLKTLGKKPCTTHADKGGSGIGFMNSFDILRKYNASLIIEQIGKPSSSNFTKIVMFKFDGKNEFKVIG